MNQDLNVFQQQSGLPGGLTPSGPASGPAADGISLSEFLQILRRRRAVILQSFVLVTVVAVVLTLMTKPVYRASARLLVENASISYNAIDTSKSKSFQLYALPITVGDNAWLCAECFLAPGVTIGEGTVIGARSVVTKSMPPWTVCAGQPCKPIKPRRIHNNE